MNLRKNPGNFPLYILLTLWAVLVHRVVSIWGRVSGRRNYSWQFGEVDDNCEVCDPTAFVGGAGSVLFARHTAEPTVKLDLSRIVAYKPTATDLELHDFYGKIDAVVIATYRIPPDQWGYANWATKPATNHGLQEAPYLTSPLTPPGDYSELSQ